MAPTLYTLPPELRLMIFSYLVPDVIYLKAIGPKRPKVYSTNVSTTVVRVCKLFNQEATPIFYGVPTFHLRRSVRCSVKDSNTKFFEIFMSKAPTAGVAAITSIKFDINCTCVQYELNLQDSHLGFWLWKWCRIWIRLPQLKEIKVGCVCLYSSANPAVIRLIGDWRMKRTKDFTPLKGMSIVVEPRNVDKTPIKQFAGARNVHLVVSDNVISIDQNKIHPPLRLPFSRSTV
ncbi:MAG: hypothetical protein LQ346_004903 [Caloplaca aetnensis]|nr:MAG: hypothetical protein LQ346_004903 [Caloplaca aetnensis]